MSTAAEYILTIDGITPAAGSPFESYSIAAENEAVNNSGPGEGVGKVSFNPFNITRKIDKSSPLLFRACCTGRHIPRITLQLGQATKAGPATKFFLTEAAVLGISEAGSAPGGDPMEQVAFTFRTFEIEVDGIVFGWDLARNAVL